MVVQISAPPPLQAGRKDIFFFMIPVIQLCTLTEHNSDKSLLHVATTVAKHLLYLYHSVLVFQIRPILAAITKVSGQLDAGPFRFPACYYSCKMIPTYANIDAQASRIFLPLTPQRLPHLLDLHYSGTAHCGRPLLL